MLKHRALVASVLFAQSVVHPGCQPEPVDDLNVAYSSGHTGTVLCSLKLQPPRAVPPHDCTKPNEVPFVPPSPPRDLLLCQPFTP